MVESGLLSVGALEARRACFARLWVAVGMVRLRVALFRLRLVVRLRFVSFCAVLTLITGIELRLLMITLCLH